MIQKPVTNLVSWFLISGQDSSAWTCVSMSDLRVLFFFFSRFLCRQNGKKKLPSFFGMDGGQERDTSTDKILQYIPAKASPSTSNPSPLLQGLIPRLFPPTPSTELGKGAAFGAGGSTKKKRSQQGMSPPSSAILRAGVGGTWLSPAGDTGTPRHHLCSGFFCFWVAGRSRASFGRCGDSFPRRNETEQEQISTEPGKGIRKGRAAPGTAQPRMAPFPALPPSLRWLPLGGPGVGREFGVPPGAAGAWGEFWESLGCAGCSSIPVLCVWGRGN